MPEQQEMQQRQVAYIVKIGDLNRGEYIEQEGWQPNFIRLGEKQISRINIIAGVIDKHTGENLSSLTLDDGSGNIQVRAFSEESAKLNHIEIGDVVIVIGRPRKYGNNYFISYEIVKKLDPLWAKVRLKELGEMPIEESGKVENITENIVKEEKVETFENEVKEEKIEDSLEEQKKILNLIKSMDAGEGAEIDGIISSSGFNQNKADEIIQDLVKAGEIYENVAGKVKIL
jgi:RPA family protein